MEQKPKKSNILRFFPYTKGFRLQFVLSLFMVMVAGGGKLHDPPGHPGHGGLRHQRLPLQPPRLFGGVDRIHRRPGHAPQPHRHLRRGLPGLRGAVGPGQLLLPHEPGPGLRGHGGPGAGHPVRPHPAPALRLAQLPPDRRHHPALHPGRGPHPQLRQRPADGGGAHGTAHRGVPGPHVRHERGAGPGGHRLFIPLVVIVSLVFYVIVGRKFQRADETEGELTALVQENLTGVRVVRAFGRERYEIDRFNKKNEEFTNMWVNLGKIMGINWGLGDFSAGFPGAGHHRGGRVLRGGGQPHRRGVSGLYRLQLHAGVACPEPGPAVERD